MTNSSTARQPRGIAAGRQFAPDSRAEPTLSLGSLAARPEFDHPEHQAVYDRHEQLLKDAGIAHHVSGEPVLAGGLTSFPVRADGREYALLVGDTRCFVFRSDPASARIPEHLRSEGDWAIETHGGPVNPGHIEEGFTFARRRAALVDALAATPLVSDDHEVFSGLSVNRSGERHEVALDIATETGNFRLEMEDAHAGARFVVMDVAAGRVLTGRMAGAVLSDALQESGRPDQHPAALLEEVSAAANQARADDGLAAGR